MKKTRAKRKASRKTKKRSIKPRLKTRFLTLILPLLTLLFCVLINEIPIPLTSQQNLIVTYQLLNTSITLYKIYVPRRGDNLLLRVGAVIREFQGSNLSLQDVYADLGAHEIPANVEILIVNYTSHVTLQGNRSYIAYLLINNTYTGIPIAYIDDKYTRSFDVITDYYPYQLHLVVRVQKCGIRVNVTDSDVKRIIVRVVSEDGFTEVIKLDTTSSVNETYVINTCGDYVEVETYSSPIPLVVIKNTQREHYLIMRESPLIILAWLMLTFITTFINQLIHLKRTRQLFSRFKSRFIW